MMLEHFRCFPLLLDFGGLWFWLDIVKLSTYQGAADIFSKEWAIWEADFFQCDRCVVWQMRCITQSKEYYEHLTRTHFWKIMLFKKCFFCFFFVCLFCFSKMQMMLNKKFVQTNIVTLLEIGKWIHEIIKMIAGFITWQQWARRVFLLNVTEEALFLLQLTGSLQPCPANNPGNGSWHLVGCEHTGPFLSTHQRSSFNRDSGRIIYVCVREKE